MDNFKDYIRSAGCSPAPDVAALDAMVADYAWFTAARVARAYVTGKADALSAVLMCNRKMSSFCHKHIDVDSLAAVTEGEIIDKFLRLTDYKIVADEADDAGEIRTQAELDDEDDLVSEELAEVYTAQGMKAEAIEIYRKLSLLNTEKSIYFAEKIEKLTNNN